MRVSRRTGALLVLVAALAVSAACRRASRDPLVTFYNPDYNLRVQHPASWKGDQAEQDGIWYRYFLGPPTGSTRKPAVSVTLFAGPLTTTVDDYSQRYLGGATVRSANVEDRQGLPVRRWDYTAADGTRASLLLVEQRQPGQAWIYGLYAQGESAPFEEHVATVEEMFKSLAIDRPAGWKEYKADGYALRVPESWRESRHFSGGGRSMLQWSSPAVGAEKAQTLHASLTLSVEPTGKTIDAYYKEQRDAQGESFALLGHSPWKGGYVDSLRTETPMATSRVKRYYRVQDGKAYVLALDAREDVFPRVSRWYDQIASTLVLDGEPAPPASPAPAAGATPCSSAIHRVTSALGRLLHGPDHLELTVGPEGPQGPLTVPDAGDGRWQVRTVAGQPCLAPTAESYYLYVVVPTGSRTRAARGAWLEVEYHGDRWAEFRVQYASRDAGADFDGLYKEAAQRWANEAMGLRSFRRAVFLLPDFDPARTQNHGASLRLEDRNGILVRRMVLHLEPPGADDVPWPAVAPRPDLRKMPGRFYPINYLFVEITNACNFKCTWCPDEIMGRRRGFMKKEKVFRILDEIAEKRSWLGPIYPVKLHQMGEPMLHPDLVQIVAHAESRGVPIELNTNCGLITEPLMDGLYTAGLTNCILSYQTPDPGSFKTRKAPRIQFDAYREKVRLAVERKVALGARTHLEIDIMNTKYSDNYRIVSEDQQAIAFLEDWIGFAQEMEAKYGLAPRPHDMSRVRSAHFLDQDENGSRYTILDGIDLVWKRCHSWGNVIVTNEEAEFTPASPGGPGELPIAKAAEPNTYCPAPYDQFVIQWNGDVVSCCTDYEGRTKVANVFAQGIETIWKSSALRRRKQDMLEGRLLDVCAKCQGLG